jgi:hypothetical protein
MVTACELVVIAEVKTRTKARAVDNRLTFFIGTRQMVVESTVKQATKLNNYLLVTTIVTSAYRDLGTFRGA